MNKAIIKKPARDKIIGVRLSKSERAQVKRAAILSGQGFSEFVRDVVLRVAREVQS
jgi:uncharacterized protein (DUF1778 family)